MTDYDVYTKNPITGITIRMKVKNAEHFSPEVQKAFKDLEHAANYPRQTKLSEYGGKS